MIQLLIEHGVDLHARERSYSTPSFASSVVLEECRSRAAINQEGADVHARDGSHSTSPHLPSSPRENAETMRLLIDHGADINARDGPGVLSCLCI